MNDRTPSALSPAEGALAERSTPDSPGPFPLLPELIAAQAAATPDALAVDGGPAGRAGLTYGALDRQANRLAHRLVALGIGPQSLVGVCLRRGPDLVVALLATWKAGAAYVPMDPDHPAERLSWALTDTRAPLVLTERAAIAALPPLGATRLLVLDEPAGPAPGAAHGADDTAVEGTAAPGSHEETAPKIPGGRAEAARRPAYVLYTSGSTGRPKGVVVPHGGIANRVRRLASPHGFGPADRVLQKTTIGFDAAGLELFAPLVSGGTVVLAPLGAERDPALMLDAVATGRITVLQAVPSVLRALVNAPGWDGCTALRLVFSAGEPLHAELCHQLLERVPQVEIWNTYGPTECSVDITEHRFDPAQTSGPVPIGRPLEGLRALVLDPQGRPVLTGSAGELHAGGVGVATGYLGRPGLTAERFVPDPFGPPGARLYRTGDRVRRSATGELEYLGRLDQQVKVNGVRIEPGEVESVLIAHPDVDAVVVDAVPDRDGGRRLVAWVQPHGAAAPSPGELREFAGRTLPGPMVPAVFVPVAAFPRTASGKTDRAALPDPGPGVGSDLPHVPPRTPAERVVARTWALTLDLPAETIGAHDDFFRAGGSSLHLGRLAVRLSAASGRRIALRDLFSATTVTAQAALLGDPDGPYDADGAQGRESAATGQDAVVPVPRGDALPLSGGQQGLWLLERMRPGSPEWADLVWMRLPGDWSERTVKAALQQLAERHEILRTHYALRGTEPVQVVEPPGRAVELRVAEAADAAALRDLAARELGGGFDLERGPVWRALLVRTADGGQVLLLGIHHIACDGWSSVLLERDLCALGEGVHTGGRAGLPEVAVQYADHAVWQRRREADGATEADGALGYWKRELSGATPLELPADRPRPAERDGRGALRTFVVPAALTARLAALGRDTGATLHQTLLTGFVALLARLSGRADFTLGMPVAGRNRPEVAQTAGYFLNTLVLRCRPDAGRAVRDALASVRETVLDALAHQELPFGRLVSELQPERDLSRTPLYQVMFDFHEEGRTGTALSGADLEAFAAAWRSARTDLTFVVHRRADGSLLGMVEYATALFNPATVDRLAACWIRLLESFVADPSMPLGDAELLPDAERARLLALGAAGPVSGDEPDGCVHAAFAESVRRTPGATAVVCGEEQWSYARLQDRADWFAHRLLALGAGPETAVAVMLPRTPDLVACLLGIWQTGAAYVPLDRALPDERLSHILADSRALVLVSDESGRARLAPCHGGASLAVDGPGHPAAPAHRPAAARLAPARLAYVIYTSGSTGRPKGVAVEHRSLLRLLRASRDHLDFGRGPDDAWLALAPATFDISLTELLMPLIAGGRVVLAREEESEDYKALVELIDRTGVTHLQAVPPQWQMLVDSGLGERPLTGQTGGEPCPPELARTLARRLKRFVNEYGPTETTIAATRWEVPRTATAVPLGRPYPHVSARVLDPLLRPVLPGTVGELCIGGPGLARGYAGRPGLTAERFVPDPYGPPGARLYRTGDLARMLPDGTLDFAGRADGQVKIRGRRVETGEVRAVLAEHPGVAEAVVVVHGTGDEARLVAYGVPSGDRLPPRGELLEHCARRLPDYMLPTLVVPLDALPLTRHHKIDFAALPAPDLTTVADDEPYTAPEGLLEEALAEIWRSVLTGPDGRAPRIGARHGFFRLGGDSIRAARVIARIQEEYDVTLPLRTLFDRPTVAALAEAVEEAVRAEIASLSDAELAAAHREYHP
ncbi:amino acid adenylation domain-containing protein [Streptomyces sp. 2224.1]|uniref:non-ribosomal peptide synthetase n=1 Tax=Streptomyces sp. 2224.1 TaxID=1881020 RepID=UPI00089D3C19|nr:non-ribosomal peptide synthetase [Streptomyces sp. 2224.1]SEB87143.1 amino acid adenylation domain-containing protein [Streptomyces sp. 2224.1]